MVTELAERFVEKMASLDPCAATMMDTGAEAGWESIAARLRGLPQALDLHRRGILRAAAEGNVAALRQVEGTAEQCEQWTGWFAELPATYGDGPLREELERGAARVNAALGGFVGFLRGELAPAAPRRDAAGRERYALWAAFFTGARLDLEETYAWGWGWEELRRIRAELADRTIEALAGVHFDVPAPLRRLECRISPPAPAGSTTRARARTSRARAGSGGASGTGPASSRPGGRPPPSSTRARQAITCSSATWSTGPTGFDLRRFHAMALDMGWMGLDILCERLAPGG